MQYRIFSMFGLIGVFLTLVAYFLLQTGKLKSTGFAYAFYNLLGSLLILTSLYDAFNLPAVVMELTWTSISIYGIWMARKRTRVADINK